MRLRVFAGVAGMCLVIAACGSKPATPPTGTRGLPPVSWAALPPPQPSIPPQAVPPSPPPGLRACRASDLVARYEGSVPMGAQGINATLFLGNRSSSACEVNGFAPGARLFTAAGAPIALKIERGSYSTSPVMIGANTGALSDADASLGLAEFSFVWPLDEVALGGIACPPTTPVAASISVELPDGGGWMTSSLVPPTNGRRFQTVTPCGSVDIEAFTAVQPPTPQSTPLPEVALGVQIKAPRQVKAGKTLSYTVIVTNLSDQAVHLGSVWPYCPGYAEVLEVLGKTVAKGSYELNCWPAPPLEPQGSASFQMELAVSTAVSGPAELHWNLDASFSPSATASTTVKVIK